LPKFFGSKSGFKNLRDFIMFVVGLGGVFWEVYTSQKTHGKIDIGTLMFFGALLGTPYVIGRDEKK
jgi:hypothetical protein